MRVATAESLLGVLTHAPFAVAVYDARPPYVCQAHNPAFRALAGATFRTTGSLVGVPLAAFFDAASAAAVRAVFEEVRTTGQPVTRAEFPAVLPPDSVPRFYTWSLSPLPASDAEPARLLLLAVEVTDLVRARAAAETRAAHVGALLAGLPAILFGLDRAGTITVLEGRGLAPFGVQPGQLVGQSVLALFREAPELRAHLDRALAGEVTEVAVELRGRVFAAWASPTRDATGAVTGVLGVATDITAQRQVAETLRAAEQRAQRTITLRALGQLAGGVAHDLNQALSLIAGYAELARTAATPAVRTDALGLIAQAAQDGGEVVQRLLAFASGQPEGPPTPVSVATLLDEVARLTAPRWRDVPTTAGRPIRLAVRVAPDDALVVRGWPGSLRQALTNLVFNAVDALPDGGTIQLDATRQGAWVELTVTDNGVGLLPGVPVRAFEPFFTTKGAHGTGLGLAQV